MANETPISVVVHGAAGRVGLEVLRAVHAADGMTLMASVDQATPDWSPGALPHYANVADALRAQKADVVVDFTNAPATLGMAPIALGLGARLIIGSTGFTDEQVKHLRSLISEHHLSGILAPNFSIGAVLLTKLAQMAAPYFDHVDVTEEHHETKVDAPSGTAMAIARALHAGHPAPFNRNVPEREPLTGTQGGEYEGIGIHSLRMPGRMAHHQVTFGGPGQTLTLRHDTINRECYMPGVLLAIRKVGGLDGLTVGLEHLMDL